MDSLIVRKAAAAAAGIYHMKSEQWTQLRLWDKTMTFSCRVPLSRNLVGPKGGMSIGFGTYIHHNEKVLVVSVSGTDNLEHWLYNLDTSTTSYTNLDAKLEVHKGFHELAREAMFAFFAYPMFKQVMGIIGTYDRVVFAGHSAGAPASCLLAMMLRDTFSIDPKKIRCFGFGSPRWLTKGEFPYQTVNLSEVYDPVTMVPKGDFKEVGHQLYYNQDNSLIFSSKPIMRRFRIWLKYTLQMMRMHALGEMVARHQMKRYEVAVLAQFYEEQIDESLIPYPN